MNSIFEYALGIIFGTWIICQLIYCLFDIDIPLYLKTWFDRIFNEIGNKKDKDD